MSAYKLDTLAAAQAAFETLSQNSPTLDAETGDVLAWDDLDDKEHANWVAVAEAMVATFIKHVTFSEAEQKIISEAIQYTKGLVSDPDLVATQVNRLTVIARMAKAVGVYR